MAFASSRGPRVAGCRLLIVLGLLGAPAASPGAERELDLRDAVVVTAPGLSGPERNAVTMLVEEVEKRTQVRWPVAERWPDGARPVIAVGTAATAAQWAGPHAATLGATGPLAAEGFRMRVGTGSAPAVLVAGNDARGVLFGIGRLLQELRMSRGRVRLPQALEVTTAPRLRLRGHQMGYRPKTNSYDAWTVPIWEQYIRDLAVFGTNAVEMIPPRSDDAPDSPHFPLPQIDMMVEVSRILDKYGLDVWLWYPALDEDYAKPATVEAALQEWGAVFAKLPRLDAVLVPGGDPGHTRPRVLFALLEKQARVLRQHHPKAQLWMSPQGFDAEWMKEFYELMKAEPAWLTGIVYGPQIRESLRQIRAGVPARYPIRLYPDITHSLNSQYPVPEWDLAYALTQGREGINPRPVDETLIFRATQDASIGFITYSEGCNDDVNKFVWSALGWDPATDPLDTLRRYSRYFIGEGYTEGFAQGLMALERNWRGPLLTNQGVDTTLAQFQAMERAAGPQDLLNWRFQQALYRAYYDAYDRRRLLYETELEHRALDALRAARDTGALPALERAEAVLERGRADPVAAPLRQRVFELAEALYQSIRMQLDVERYRAISVGRGANLATIDVPLHNGGWLRAAFGRVRAESDEAKRLDEIDRIARWTDPGPGGFYDDLGKAAADARVVPGRPYAEDPQYFDAPLVAFGCRREYRLSWCDYVDGLYGYEAKLAYTGLDPAAAYRLRIVYSGSLRDRDRPVQVRLSADGLEVHPMMPKPDPLQPVEFDIPAEAVRDGALTLTCSGETGRGGPGRGCQMAEVWLMRR
jgi:hypothetical protein